MMPNKTSQLRELYFQQNQSYLENQIQTCQKTPVLNWPSDGYLNQFKPDAQLLEDSLQKEYEHRNIADRIFGSQKRQNYFQLKHSANLFYERCTLHNNHIHEIDNKIMDVSGNLFGVEINNFPDKARRQSNLENQLLQLEHQRREEELSFWKDTVDLRKDLFESAVEYKTAANRYQLLSGLESKYGRYYH